MTVQDTTTPAAAPASPMSTDEAIAQFARATAATKDAPVVDPVVPAVTDPPAVADVPDEKRDPMSAKFAALAKEERRIQQLRLVAKEETKGLPEFQAAKKNALKDPIGYVKAAGLDVTEFYDNLTQVILGEKTPQNAEVRELHDKLKALEEQTQKEREDKRQADQRDEANRAKAYVKDELVKAGDEFELVNQYGRHDLVCDIIADHWKQHKVELPIKEAAARVETYLEQEAEKFVATKKYKSKYAQAMAPTEKLPTPSSAPPPKTLTNQASGATTEPLKLKTRDEELKWAVGMLTK